MTSIDEIKKYLGIPKNIYITRKQFCPASTDVCWIEGLPFSPMLYKEIVRKKICVDRICKCQSYRSYMKDTNWDTSNIMNLGTKEK